MPYIVVDEFGVKDANGILTGGLFKSVKDELSLSVLNYQYGYKEELAETLKQYTALDSLAALKFPLVWLEQPFTIQRSGRAAAIFGSIESVRLFICTGTDINYKAEQRMAINFKPILYPIYMETLNQIDLSQAFSTQSRHQIQHSVSDRYFWGELEVALDRIDFLVITFQNLIVSQKPIC